MALYEDYHSKLIPCFLRLGILLTTISRTHSTDHLSILYVSYSLFFVYIRNYFIPLSGCGASPYAVKSNSKSQTKCAMVLQERAWILQPQKKENETTEQKN